MVSKVTGKGSPTSQPSGNFWVSCDCFWVSCDCFWIKILISFLQDFEIFWPPDHPQAWSGRKDERQIQASVHHRHHQTRPQCHGVGRVLGQRLRRPVLPAAQGHHERGPVHHCVTGPHAPVHGGARLWMVPSGLCFSHWFDWKTDWFKNWLIVKLISFF